MHKVFIDGKEGTTGLRIRERLLQRKDIELVEIEESMRKDEKRRLECIQDSDITFLCLPDQAAVEIVEKAADIKTTIIDASTAHRTDDNWAYGFPELSAEHRKNIKESNRIANPGCHASGAISLIYPLKKAGVLPEGYPLSAFSITGYSGGGKKMIAQYRSEERDVGLLSPRQYGLGQEHKHLKEIKKACGLDRDIVFSPIVADYYSGMTVTVPMYINDLKGIRDKKSLEELFINHYKDQKAVRVVGLDDGFLNSNALSGKDDMEIAVCGNDERVVITSRFDNLGKGASGSAVQCMNIRLGIDETTGLNI